MDTASTFLVLGSLCLQVLQDSMLKALIFIFIGCIVALPMDINFSDDSKWIVISFSRGTSHLFALTSFEEAAELQSREIAFANNLHGSDFMTNSLGNSLHSSSSPKHIHLSLFSSGTPVTLTAVSRIRNGNPRLKGTVCGAAAAAATGKVSPSYGVIASAFHNCNGSQIHAESSSSMSTYYLLVFSPAGSVIQYVLRQCDGEDYGTNLSALDNSSYQSIHEANSRLDVETFQKWDVCHKRNRIDRGDNVDIYGDQANNWSSNHFQMEIKKGTNIPSADTSVDKKIKLSREENLHIYLSEVELQAHEAKTPLWTKSEICFHVMMDENIEAYDSSYCSEVEIEKIACCMFEAKSKFLVPVFDNFRTRMSQRLRLSASFSNQSEVLHQQKSGQLESGRLWYRSHNSQDYDYGNHSMAEFPSSISDNNWNQSMTEANEGFVNNNTHDQYTTSVCK